MKTIKLLLFACGLFIAGSVQAQVSLRINLGSPPQWGPVGYSDVHYYYLPDVEAYYDVQSSMFIYMNAGRWVRRSSLPLRYRNYDLYNGYKVVMSDYHGNTPYNDFRQHKMKYAKGYHGEQQRSIGNRPGNGNYRNSPPMRSRTYQRDVQQRGQNDRYQKNNKSNKENGRGGDKGRKK
ncbi:MAG: hypothetical protein WC699_14835 [Bacteroidales bacterium]|jgi:hypothetical protein